MASSSMLCNYARRSIGLRRLPLPSLHIQQMAIQQRDYANEVDGAGQSTGIEHALKFKQSGQANKCDFEKDYKCIEYLHFNKYSYYDIECKMQELRCPQPTNKQPDIEPKIKSQ